MKSVARDTRVGKKGFRRLHCKVALITRDMLPVAFAGNGTAAVFLQRHLIGKCHALHHHTEIVVPVFTAAENIQRQIQFCRSAEDDFFHSLFKQCSDSKKVTGEIAGGIRNLVEMDGVTGAYVYFDNGSTLYLTEDAQKHVLSAYGEESILTGLGVGKESQWRTKPANGIKDAPGYTKIQKAIDSATELDDSDYACVDYSSNREGEKKVTYTVPIRESSGKIIALLGVEISKTTLTELITDDVNGTYFIGVSDKDKNFIQNI